MQYVISPAIVASVFLWGIRRVYNLGKLAKEHSDLIEEHTASRKSLSDIRDAIVEIQTILSLKFGKIEIKHILSRYGEAHSPIALKKEYLEMVKDSRLDLLVAAKKKRLVTWLEKQKPKTGLDAQDIILALVVSGEISHYLDLTAFKQYLYEHGETSDGADSILAIYLFETLIPELHFSLSNKSLRK